MQISLNEKTKDHLVHGQNVNEFAPNPPPTKKQKQKTTNQQVRINNLNIAKWTWAGAVINRILGIKVVEFIKDP